MLQNIENLKLISVLKGSSVHNAVHTNYPHRLILRLEGSLRYDLQDETLILGPGDALFLPNSPKYRGTYASEGPFTYILINFEGNLPDTEARAYPVCGNQELHHLFIRIYRSWSVHTPANRCRCMALLYEILACFAEADKNETVSASAVLEPALEFLEDHIFDPQLRIGGLHELCGVSDTYFRRMFLARFGVAPKRYVLDRRLAQAKAILDNGEFSSIGEVALLTGFEDALYFSKVFRKKYGHAPSDW
ncbi:MAG: helix-turn-helix transcriptional regulator [Lachnospiraceae bacterium]|nr:helix-turn-helix transcriptional regulator [Lachnospiraceae bacterium]